MSADSLSTSSLTEYARWRNLAQADVTSLAAVAFDTYSDRRPVPQHQITADFHRSARSKLRDDGSLYANQLVTCL